MSDLVHPISLAEIDDTAPFRDRTGIFHCTCRARPRSFCKGMRTKWETQ